MEAHTLKELKLSVSLVGVRPLMFDRYAGDNSTQLPVMEKMYLDSERRLTIPSLNIYSLLCAENTKSVCRLFFGKKGKNIAMGIAAFTSIQESDILIHDDNGPIKFAGFGGQIVEHRCVARVKGGVPNPKQRPMLNLPWKIDFNVDYVENKECTLENLRQAFAMGGILGLGTFKPFFGRYNLARFDVQE